MLDNLKIVDYDKKYAKEINKLMLDLWNETFKDYDNIIGKVAMYNNQFAGVAYGKIINDNIFYFDVLFVKFELQKHGIGTILAQELLNQVKTYTKGAKAYLLDSKGHGPRSRKIFERLGFKLVQIIPGYFAIDNDYEYCPDCDSTPCICRAWEYRIDF